MKEVACVWYCAALLEEMHADAKRCKIMQTPSASAARRDSSTMPDAAARVLQTRGGLSAGCPWRGSPSLESSPPPHARTPHNAPEDSPQVAVHAG